MDLRSMKSRSKLLLGIAVAGAMTVVGVLVLQPGTSLGGVALAQNPDPQPTGSIQRITASTPNVALAIGETVVLSIDVIGRQNVQDQNLGNGIEFDWSASGGRLPEDADGTSVTYTAPSAPGTYTVTVSPSSGCVGTGSDCTATFRISVHRQGEATGPDAPPRSPPGVIPTILNDSDGAQYEVFTPEDGGSFQGEGFWITAAAGVIPNGEVIGVRIAVTGSASNAGMSHHRYTLYGDRYSIFAVDAMGGPLSSYRLEGPAEICIPIPSELRSSITDVGLVGINDGSALTALTSWVRVSPVLIACGNLSLLPATIAAGIPGSPPPAPTATPEPTPALPPTGGTAPTSSPVFWWAMLIGFAMVAIAVLAVSRRRPEARKD